MNQNNESYITELRILVFFVFFIQMLYRNKITGYAITILTLRSTKIVLQQSEIFSFENEIFFIQVKDEEKKEIIN